MWHGHRPADVVTRGLPGARVARFFEARGRPVFECDGALWVKVGRAFFQNLPFEARIDPDRAALRRALRAARAAGALYATRTRPGVESGLFVCAPSRYSLASVEAKSRRQVRRGLERCELRRMDPDELLAAGRELNLQTMARQKRMEREFADPLRWRRFVEAARDTPGMRIDGAYVDGRLSAYSVACREGAWLHLLYKMSRTDDMQHRAAIALDFWMLTEAAKDPTIETVSSSYVGLAGESLDHYKRSMGFEVMPLRRTLELHPALKVALANPLAATAAGLALRARPRSAGLRRVASLLEYAR